MKLHLFHFSPHGLVRALSHIRAGRRLCKRFGLSLRSLIPGSINSMTAAYNVVRTIEDNQLEPPQTFIDIGANESQMIKMLSPMKVSARHLSFEPNPSLKPLGEVHRIALSDSDGEVKLFLPSDDSGWGTIEAGAPNVTDSTRHHTVQTNRMQTLIEDEDVEWSGLPGPIFVKIDTEGSEKKVLDGFGPYLKDVAYLLIEVENREQRGENYTLMSLVELLAPFGFNRIKIVYACYDGPVAPAYCDILFWKG